MGLYLRFELQFVSDQNSTTNELLLFSSNRLLWMLLNHLGHQNAAKVAAIPLENYPVLLSLTVERGSLVLQQVVNDSRHAPSVETVFGESIRIQENFTRPTKPMTNFNDRFVTEASLDAWPPKNDSYEKLSTESEEYRTVAEKFDEKLFEIKSIYRLVRKKSLKNDDETSRKEFLYHGCLRETCRQILIGGFHKNLIGLHGKRHENDASLFLSSDGRFFSVVDEKDGDGYVFTTTPERSLIYALPNLSSQDNGDRTMLVCRVQIDPSWKPKEYRTWDMHDIPIEKAPVSGPSGIHVVFSNERIRPLYLVEFRKIGRFS